MVRRPLESRSIALKPELQKTWINLFCLNLPKEDVQKVAREQFFRCAYQVDAYIPEGLQNFYLINWEISFQNWQELTSVDI